MEFFRLDTGCGFVEVAVSEDGVTVGGDGYWPVSRVVRQWTPLQQGPFGRVVFRGTFADLRPEVVVSIARA